MMKRLDSKRGKRLLLWGSIGIAGILGILSFVSVHYTVGASRNGDASPLSLNSIKKLFTAFPQSNTATPIQSDRTISDFLKNPRQGAKVVGNRFIASENFPDDKKLAFDILFAEGDSACGYNKIKGLQCGGATSVFHDIKGVCLTTTPIPFDPCCGAPPQIDPRDPTPACPEPTCPSSEECFCAPPPEGCTCLPLACNCFCAARASGGEFAWLWDSVTEFCGCNP